MKKCVSFILLIFIIFSICFIEPVFAKKAKSSKQKIEFTTKDKYILVGNLYLSKVQNNKPFIILLHSFGLNSFSWGTLPLELKNKGYNVLAMDLRGHGRSVYNEDLKLKSRYYFKASDWQKLPDDVLQSIDYVKSNYPKVNTNSTIIVGCDLGASVGVLAGDKMKSKPSKFVLVSPIPNFKGLYIPVKITNFTNSKFMLIASSQNKGSINNINTLKKFIQSTPIVKLYPSGGDGNQLLKVNPQSNNDIINFISN